MKIETISTIRNILQADGSLTPEAVDRITSQLNKQATARKKPINLKQAAAIIKVHPKTVDRYAKQGKLSRIVHSKRKIRYDLEEVERFASEGITAK